METQAVSDVPKYKFAFAAAMLSDAAPLMVPPVDGYTASAFAPSLRTTIIAPTSAGGNLTPVPAAAVATRVTTADTEAASPATDPVAVTEADTSPQIACV
jgi:hypothetical protein